MKKAVDLVKDNLKTIDAVIEVRDARIPYASANPMLTVLVYPKPRLLVLNKEDVADPKESKRWIQAYRRKGLVAVTTDGRKPTCLPAILGGLEQLKKQGKKRRGEAFRLMVVGVPNTGKSSLINRCAGRKAAQTGNKPGLTRGKQWIRLTDTIHLLDMPGLLQPKLDEDRGRHLAFCASINDEILDLPSLALDLLDLLSTTYPKALMDRYHLTGMPEKPLEIMEAIAVKRAFLLSAGRIDYDRVARTLLKEFRTGLIGRISLEKAADYEDDLP